MDDHNSHDDTGRSLGNIAQTAMQLGKTAAQAAMGNIPGAIFEAVQSSGIKKLVLGIAIIIASIIMLITLAPSLLFTSVKIGGDDGQLIRGMGSQVNGVFAAALNSVIAQVNGLMEEGDTIRVEAVAPPIPAYRIMAYYSASVYHFGVDPKTLVPTAKAKNVNETVLGYEQLIKQECAQNGIPQFVSVIEAIIMQESGGSVSTGDIMQCEFGATVTPEKSIIDGVAHFAGSLRAAGCATPEDLPKLQLAMQNYNMGDYFSAWVKENKYSGWSISAARAFHDYEVSIGAGGGPSGQIYGDVNYVPHVFAYWNGSVDGGADLINVEDLLKILHTYDEYYFTYTVDINSLTGNKVYTIKSILDTDPGYFETTVFKLTPDQKEYSKKYEELFYEYSSTGYAGLMDGAIGGWAVLNGSDSREISSLSSAMIPRVENFLSKAEEKGYHPTIVAAFRSMETQQAYYNQGRTTPGDIITYARPGESYHNYGMAVDMSWDGMPPSLIREIAAESGLEWGGDWPGFADTPHLQIAGVPLSQLQSGAYAAENGTSPPR